MNNKKIIINSLLTGVIVSGSGMASMATNSLDFKTLGSGGEVRTELLNKSEAAIDGNLLELTCGDKDAKSSKKAEGKDAEAKCGDGNCGDDAKKAKTESKDAEAKCGDGNCGDDAKSSKKDSKESKSKEATCA